MSKIPRQRWATRAELLERVELTRSLIELTPERDLDIAGLARIAAISESHYVRLFHDTYGLSPIQMLAERRLALACELLKSGHRVQEVTIEIGYTSVPTFCRRFKARYGLTPHQYQMRNFG